MATASHYVLGGFTFDTIDEYWLAQHDLKKIDIIRRELDTNDPEVAVRLYNMIRDGKIVFDSPIGKEFSDHVVDVMAHNSEGLLDDKRTVDTAASKVRVQKYLGATIVCMAIALGIFFGSSQIRDVMTARNLEHMAEATRLAEENTAERMQTAAANAEIILANAQINNATSDDVFNPTSKVNEAELTVLPEYASLLAQNPDVKGWLKIEGTQVDYPVLQRIDDNEYYQYYIDKDFQGRTDPNGSLFIDYRCNIVNPTENTIIYGHNMNSGMMFGDLKKYLDRNFYFDHKTIKFNTLYEEKSYEIVAVCLTEVYNVNDKNFRYYEFTDATSQAQWDAFIDNVNNLNIYSTDVDLKLGDRVLTLSTCNNYTEDGRLFLVAKCIN